MLIKTERKNNNKEVNMHGTDLLPYEIYRTAIPMLFTSFPMHWHEEIEIVYVISGCAKYIVDFNEYIINKGDILIIPPSSLHYLEQYKNEEFDAMTIIFAQNMVSNNLIDICSIKYILPIFNNEVYLPVHIKSDETICAEIRTHIIEAITEHFNKKAAYEIRIRIAFLNIIQAFYKENLIIKVRNTASSMNTIKLIKIVTNYIEAHFDEKILLEDLAKYANISVYHLSHIFKKCTGQSPNEYINFYRLTMAANRLLAEDTQILNIAIECGYNNISYFNRIFKKKYGVTPKEYRNNYMN